MKIIENRTKLTSRFLRNIYENKLLKFFYLAFIIFLWVFLISKYNFGKGIDFTDTTLSYAFSLKILNGEIPFKDFHLVITPLAFYIEAFFHRIFGENYLVNAYLALFNLFIQTYFLYLIFLLFTKKNIKSLLSSMLIMGIVGNIHQSIHFGFSPLAETLSIASIYFGILSLRRKYHLLTFGVLFGLTFLTKQTFGIAIYAGYLFYLSLDFLFLGANALSNIRKLLIFTSGALIVLVPFFTYFYSIGASSELVYALTTGTERKGINLFSLDTLNSLIPFLQPKIFFASIFLSLWTIYLYFAKNKKYIFLTFLSIISLGILSIYFHGKLRALLNVLLYDSPKLLMPIFIGYICFYKKNLDKKLILFLSLSFSFIYINELSWPGRGPSFIILTSLFLFIIADSILTEDIKENGKISNQLISLTLLISNLILGLFSVFFPKENLYRDFNTKNSLTLKPFLFKRKISSEHKELILSSKKYLENYCNNNNTAFIFPWAPILYEFIGAKNISRFYLPYHDWLTLTEADEIINNLKENKPCMLIVYKSSLSLSGKNSPFSALAMRRIEKFIKEDFLENYIYINKFNSLPDDKIIFIRKNQ